MQAYPEEDSEEEKVKSVERSAAGVASLATFS